MTKNALHVTLCINILIFFFVFAQYLIFLLQGEYYFRVLQFEILIVFTWCIITCYKVTRNWFCLEILFFGVFFLFLLSRIFLNLLFPDFFPAYGESQWLSGYKFQDSTVITLKFLLLVSLISLHIGLFVGYLSFDLCRRIVKREHRYLNRDVAILFLIIGLTAFLMKVIHMKNILDNYGYFALYSGKHTPPLVVRVLDNFFYVGFFMFVCTFPKKRIAYRLSFVFILLYATYIFTGMRAEFVLMLLTTFWLLALIYDWKSKFIVLLAVTIVIILFSQLSLLLKYGLNFDTNGFLLLGSFLYSQGVSLLVLGYVIDLQDLFSSSMFGGVKHIIAPYTSKVLMLLGDLPPRTIERVEIVHSIGDRLTYELRPNLYVKGGGTGSSYIAELYSLGGSLVIVSVFNVFIGFAIVYLTRRFIFHPYGLFIATFIVPGILWMPRSALLYPTIKLIVASWFLIIIMITLFMIRRNEK